MDSDDRKISQLPLVTSLSDSDLFVVVVDLGTAPKTRGIAKSNAIPAAGGGGSSVEGILNNGYFQVSVVSNDLVVEIKTTAGADPSAVDPVTVFINGTERSIEAATSITLADGTNWFASGSASLAALEVDYFVYAVWDSNSSVVAISIARIPYGKTVNATDFSATNTNARYLANYGNFTVGDDITNIGRFAATLSAAAGHTWTVPTFTGNNLIRRPIFTTRRLSFAPAWTNLTVGNGTAQAFYVISENLTVRIELIFGSTTSISGDPSHSFIMPFSSTFLSGGVSAIGLARLKDATGGAIAAVMIADASAVYIRAQNSSVTYLEQSTPSSTVPFTWTTNDQINLDYSYVLQ